VLLSTTFLNEDQSLVTIVMNPEDEAIDYHYYIGSQVTEIKIPPHAMQTLRVQ
jgi:glucosylceramidase